jgi:hypothetical protein
MHGLGSEYSVYQKKCALEKQACGSNRDVVEKGLEEKVNYDKGQSLNPRFVIAIK